jgi:hypothetical protein
MASIIKIRIRQPRARGSQTFALEMQIWDSSTCTKRKDKEEIHRQLEHFDGACGYPLREIRGVIHRQLAHFDGACVHPLRKTKGVMGSFSEMSRHGWTSHGLLQLRRAWYQARDLSALEAPFEMEELKKLVDVGITLRVPDINLPPLV